MSYYHRRYRRPYNHRRRRNYDRSLPSLQGIFAVGIAFIILGSVSSIASGNYVKILGSFFVWAIIIISIVFLVKKIRSHSKDVQTFRSDEKPDESIPKSKHEYIKSLDINSDKHGCKCYMEGLNDGERDIAHTLAEQLSYKDYFIFNNLIVPVDGIGSSQIDHLVVSRFGIFVVESKDILGWIRGASNMGEWTTTLPGGKVSNSFQNPIRQNWSHIMALRGLLPFTDEQDFHSLVVFSDKGEIKSEPIEGVGKSDYMITYIKGFKQERISEENIHLIIGKLSYICQTADISPEQHIHNLRAHHATL